MNLNRVLDKPAPLPIPLRPRAAKSCRSFIAATRATDSARRLLAQLKSRNSVAKYLECCSRDKRCLR
jgi:hypothetical protein